MADLEERIRIFLKNIPHGGGEEDPGDGGMAVCGGGDTFAERAEWFFKKRPELLSLVQELYNNYISLKESSSKHDKNLSTRVMSTLSSSQDTRSQFGLQHINYFRNLIEQQQEEQEIDMIWDIESSVSYHQTPTTTIPDIDEEHHHHHGKHLFRTGSWCSSPYDVVSSFSSKSRTGLDELVSHIVIKNVEQELIKAQMGEIEHQNRECTTKMEILKSLVEVLESERVVLLDENSRLGYKVSNLMQENQEMGSEAVFLKRKAAQLTRCLMKIREDHSVCVLTRKIEDLQEQIHGLEKRNQDFLETTKKMKMMKKRKMKKKEGFDLGLMGCFQSEKIKFKKRNEEEDGVEGVRRGRKLWEKVKKGINFPTMFIVHGVSSSSCSSSSSVVT